MVKGGQNRRLLGALALAGATTLLVGFNAAPLPAFVPPIITPPLAPALTLTPAARVARTGLPVGELCLGSPPCEDPRRVWVDYAAVPATGRLGGEWVTYDLAEVTRPIDRRALAQESELSIAVRTVVSEVGADRLLTNRYGVLEAIGILFTLDNRLDPAAYNPEDRDGAPVFPGLEGSLSSCANPNQYNGNGTWRALNPRRRYAPAVLDAAVDIAVIAWWLQDNGYVDDFTDGATNYVHRCGGAAYGLTTHHCDRHMGRPERDVPGAEPHTGPVVFRAPARWLPGRGYYALHESVRVEFDPWWSELGARTSEPPDTLTPGPRRFGPDAAMGADAQLASLAEAVGPPQDAAALAVLRASWVR
jgi:hypothetical protein